MPKVDGLTVKEIKLIKGILAGKTKQAAAMEAYNASTPEAASSIASNTLKKVNVQEALQAELAKQGLTLDKVVAPVVKAMNATIKVRVDGETIDTGQDDLEMQLKGHDRAMKILNVNQAKEGGNTIIFNKGDVVASKYVKD